MENIGKIACEAYGGNREWKTVGGGVMPSWDDQAPELRAAWEAAASAVASAVLADMANHIDQGPGIPLARERATRWKPLPPPESAS